MNNSNLDTLDVFSELSCAWKAWIKGPLSKGWTEEL
jgi:hypothetical protein